MVLQMVVGCDNGLGAAWGVINGIGIPEMLVLFINLHKYSLNFKRFFET